METKTKKNTQKRHTRKDFYKIIYLFHDKSDCRQTNIASELGIGTSYVADCLTEYLDKRMDLGELARTTKSMDKFVDICIKDEESKK